MSVFTGHFSAILFTRTFPQPISPGPAKILSCHRTIPTSALPCYGSSSSSPPVRRSPSCIFLSCRTVHPCLYGAGSPGNAGQSCRSSGSAPPCSLAPRSTPGTGWPGSWCGKSHHRGADLPYRLDYPARRIRQGMMWTTEIIPAIFKKKRIGRVVREHRSHPAGVLPARIAGPKKNSAGPGDPGWGIPPENPVPIFFW